MPRGKENSVSKGGGREKVRVSVLPRLKNRENPHLPCKQTNNSREKVEFARDRAAIEFQWRTMVLNGLLSDALERRYCGISIRDVVSA